MFGKCLKAREESHRVRLDPDLRGGLEGEGGVSQGEIGPRPEGRDFLKRRGVPLSVVRGTQLSSLIILALFNVVLVDYEREPMIKEGKSGVKM